MSKASLGPYDEPMKIVCIDGEVVVVGPAHMHGAFTPDAAQASAAQLAQMALEARSPPADAVDGSEEIPP